jgi:hypothetical protein
VNIEIAGDAQRVVCALPELIKNGAIECSDVAAERAFDLSFLLFATFQPAYCSATVTVAVSTIGVVNEGFCFTC